MELFKRMHIGNREHILRILNKWWEAASAPEELSSARAVSFYMKGNTDDPANYRPIFLSNSMHKVCMSVIRTDCNKHCPMQYGFRQSPRIAHDIDLI